MAKGKKTKTGGKARSTPNRRSNTPRTPPSRGSQRGNREDSSDEYESASFKPFSLRDAASRRPQDRASPWAATGPGTFRHQSIGFVRSSGVVSPTVEAKDAESDMVATKDNEVDVMQTEEDELEISMSNAEITITKDVVPDTSRQTQPAMPLNLPAAAAEEEDVQMLSDAASESGDEVVVFQGRNRPSKEVTKPKTEAAIPTPQVVQQIPDALDITLLRESLLEPAPPVTESKAPSEQRQAALTQKQSAKARIPTSKVKPSKKKVKVHKSSKRQQEEEVLDEVIADYVANMREHGIVDEELDEETETVTPAKNPFRSSEWTTSEIEDFDDFSTSDEVMEILSDVLSKRTRPSGVQYLVVWDGQSIDDARWIHEAALTMQGAAALLEAFEEAEKNIPEYPQDSDDSSEDTDDDDIWEGTNDEASDDDDDINSEEDELEAITDKISRMSDEQIARLLAKQEELGMGSDELLLFDDDEEESIEEGNGLEDFLAFEKSKKHKGKGSRKATPTKRKGHQVSVDDMLDGEDYGDFDVMDHERPSLNSARKNRDQFVSFGLSDSEMELNLQETWAADRKRKGAKKQEREELRAQGLLGKKNKFKPDLNAKFRDGISMDSIGQELEAFLSAAHETMALPPMNKKDRKMMHEVAAAFNLKSKSAGKGKARFPVLYKTSRTRDFNHESFTRVQMQLKRRFFTRMDTRGGPSRGGFTGSRSGGIGGGDLSYREGDVVGGTAPELGADNRGHAMLEKMGWTSGMALGAVNNKGILVPVTHVVKKTRTGLG